MRWRWKQDAARVARIGAVLAGVSFVAASGSSTPPGRPPGSPGVPAMAQPEQQQPVQQPAQPGQPGQPAPGGAGSGTVPVPAAPSGATVAPPAGGTGAATGAVDDLQLCVDETNRYRATLGLPAVRRSADLERCALTAARADHASGRPHGHFVDTKGCGIAFAENEIPRWPVDYAGSTTQTIRKGLADMWAEGPGGGHFENMRGKYTELGCGIHVEGGAITVVQNFR